MLKEKKDFTWLIQLILKILQFILNVSLIVLAVILSFLLVKELIVFFKMLLVSNSNDYQLFLANILIFFLYFEFISMIVKYFKENYHFPLRYFIYIGITAMIRVIIVDHDSAVNTLLYSLVILVLIIGYYIMHMTPRDRKNSKET